MIAPAQRLNDVTTYYCLLYTSDAADERSSVDLGGRRIIKKNTRINLSRALPHIYKKKIISRRTTKL